MDDPSPLSEYSIACRKAGGGFVKCGVVVNGEDGSSIFINWSTMDKVVEDWQSDDDLPKSVGNN